MWKIQQRVTLSDWIVFLTSKSNLYVTIIICCATIALSLFAIFFIIWNFQLNIASMIPDLRELEISQEIFDLIEDRMSELRTIMEFLLAVIAIVIFIGATSYASYRTPRKLLNEIMTIEETIDLIELRNRWYKRMAPPKYNFPKWKRKGKP